MTKYLITILIAATIFVGCTQAPDTNTGTNTTNNSVSAASDDAANNPRITLYTLGDVAPHNNRNDCWMVIEGKVYDVTSFIPTHPGGDEILKGCGKDATSMFNSRPTDGTSHSTLARAQLQSFYIGDLVN